MLGGNAAQKDDVVREHRAINHLTVRNSATYHTAADMPAFNAS